MADNYEINVTLDEVFGTGIRSVDQTVTSDEPGGQNEITVTLTNGETNTFYVKNGPEGRAGTDGKDGTSSGYPVPVTLVSEMTDPHIMYLYGGNEEGYRANHIYHLEDGELVDYGEYGAPADYVQNARRDQRYGYDQGGTVVYEDRLVYFDTIKNGEPQTVQFSERLYRETGNNEDGALTQKATTEAIESSMSLPVVTYGEAAEYDPTVMEVTIDPNTLYVLNGIGTAFTSVEIIRNVAIEKEDRLNRYMVRFVTGGSLANLSFTNATPALLSLKTETTYDIEIINGIVHVWEDGQAIGNVLDTTATANAVTAWLNNHPEATTTVADGSITTAKLASSVIDNTLSTPGSAADAKKTGDEISELKSHLPFSDVADESEMTDTSLMYRMDGFIYYYDNSNDAWKRVGSGSGGSGTASGDLPVLYLVGDVSQMSKDVRSQLQYTFVDSANHTQRTGWCDAKWQGDSSLSYPKKNYTFRFYHDPSFNRKDKINYFDLTKQSKWVTKANWIDHSHARNIVSARLWSAIVHSRVSAPPELLTASPNNGAIDGEPIVIYLNGSYLGLYTMNIPKDDFTFGMDAENPLHCCAYGNKNTDGSNVFRTASVNGWDNEVPEEWTESTRNGLIALINFVMTSSDADFKANLNNYLDVESAIDYYLFCYFIGASDSLVVNQILLTYDGGSKWYYSAYDLDSTWGLYWNGSRFYPYDMACPEDYQNLGTGYNLLFQRLETNFGNELYARYRKLRASVLSLDYINREFEYFMGQIPQEAYDDDILKWTNIPQKSVDHLNQIETWIANRAEYVDAEIADMASPVPCTGISLSETSLSFTDFGTHQLVASVQPSDCTQTVRWSSSDETVATVSQNGLVTLLANGTTTITVTCGSYSATCAITMAYDEYGWSALNQYDINTDGEVISGSSYKSKQIAVEKGAYTLSGTSFTWLKIAIYKNDDTLVKLYSGKGNATTLNADVLYDDCYAILIAYPKSSVKPSADLSFTNTGRTWTLSGAYSIDTQSGEVNYTSNNIITVDFLPVDGGATYTLSGSLTWKNIYQYDSNKNYLKCETTVGNTNDKTVTMESNAAYVMLSGIGNATNAEACTFTKQ